MNVSSSAAPRDSIVFLTRSLERGGAERQLILLAHALRQRGHKVAVVTFYDGGALSGELRGTGVRVISLGKRGRWDIARFLFHLVRHLRRERPMVLHGYLTVANVLTAILKPLLPGTRVVWGVRASDMDLSQYDWFARLTDHIERTLAHCADRIIVNSQAGLRHALSRGFPASKATVVPNGIDTLRFRPDAEGRARARAEWGVPDTAVLIGVVARLDPMKDHPNFLRAASIVARHEPDVRFVSVGGGSAASRTALQAMSRSLGIESRVVWAGAWDDMRAAYNALDVCCSSSAYGEGFSNSVAEAMACGTPCVVTDVGDSALVVGATGAVVAPRKPEELAHALLRMIRMSPQDRADCGMEARRRIETEFSVERLTQRTLEALGFSEYDLTASSS
ncbi:MAG: glycosyltransferase [Steroidobacteraceae bacterium]|nr:glycosyltransferase [Steroidobacteraceae bacterium]